MSDAMALPIVFGFLIVLIVAGIYLDNRKPEAPPKKPVQTTQRTRPRR